MACEPPDREDYPPPVDSMNISSQGSFTFYYDPAYEYSLSLNSNLGGTNLVNSVDGASIIGEITSFQVSLTPVVPEPVSSVPFLTGGTLFAARTVRKRRRADVQI